MTNAESLIELGKLSRPDPTLNSSSTMPIWQKDAKTQLKARWDLIPVSALREVASVLTFGAAKYDDDNWKRGFEDPKQHAESVKQYRRAAIEHIQAVVDQGPLDTGKKGSGLHHYAHAICCCLFLLWDELEQLGEEPPEHRLAETVAAL